VEVVVESQETTLNYEEEIEEDSESLFSMSMVGDQGRDCTSSILVYTYSEEKTRELIVERSTKITNDKTPIDSHKGKKPNIRVHIKPKFSTEASIENLTL